MSHKKYNTVHYFTRRKVYNVFVPLQVPLFFSVSKDTVRECWNMSLCCPWNLEERFGCHCNLCLGFERIVIGGGAMFDFVRYS